MFITIIALFWPAREAPPAAVVIMNQPYVIPPVKVGFLDGIMPTSKAWAPLWRLRYALLGRRQEINIQSTIIDLTGSNPLAVINCLPSQPDFASSDGTQVWRLKEVELKGLRKRLKEARDDHILDSSRVIMGDETEAHVLSGNSILINGKLQQVGFSVDLLPRIHKATIDLTIVVVHSQPITNQPNSTADDPQASSVSIRTNFALGGRFQLPRESVGIFVLHSVPGLSNQGNMGLLITPQVIKAKK